MTDFRTVIAKYEALVEKAVKIVSSGAFGTLVPEGDDVVELGIADDGGTRCCPVLHCETIPAGTVVTFIIGEDAAQAYYMPAPNDKRSMSVRRG